MSEGVGAFDTRFAEDCSDDDALWELIFVPYPGGYQLRNYLWGLNLELRNDESENGTDAVVILSGPEPVQVFRIWSLPSMGQQYSLTPLQASGRCLGAGDNGKAEIWDCIVENAYQQWSILPVVCAGEDAGFVAPPIGG
jgi:hypothetical protein